MGEMNRAVIHTKDNPLNMFHIIHENNLFVNDKNVKFEIY